MSREVLLVIVIVAVLLLLGCLGVMNLVYGRLKKSNDALMKSYRELEELNGALRAQRHDQLNHLQVVYGMMELGEYDEVKSYLEPVYKEFRKTGKALKTSRPAINALLMAKGQEAERRGTDLFIEVKTDLQELTIPDWELCKVLSNLIDNALTALEEREEERQLRIDITENREEYVFEVANNGPQIPPEFMKVMFKQGISTKKEEGHGMGLAIVQSTLAGYGGRTACVSDEEETVFTVYLPKKN